MITSDKIFRMIENFERVLPYATKPGSLDMGVGDVSLEFREPWSLDRIHLCGTTHCHAGWYALAKRWDLRSKFLTRWTDFRHGRSDICEDLGFGRGTEAARALQLWAKYNPQIWGNGNGSAMFRYDSAFNHSGRLTLQKIVDHWGEVGMRLLFNELSRLEEE